MSRQLAALPLALLAVSSLGACATIAGGESTQAVADASGAPPGTRPIDRRAREQVAREDSLTQMAFWAAEYQTFPNDLEAAQRFSEALRRGGRTDEGAISTSQFFRKIRRRALRKRRIIGTIRASTRKDQTPHHQARQCYGLTARVL